MRFLIDMPLTPDLAGHLASKGHDATHASLLGLAFAPDEQLIALAKSEGRILLTADLDYPRLLAQSGDSGPAVILLRGGDYSDMEMMVLVDRVLAAIPEEQLVHSFVVVDRRRIRRRDLPLR